MVARSMYLGFTSQQVHPNNMELPGKVTRRTISTIQLSSYPRNFDPEYELLYDQSLNSFLHYIQMIVRIYIALERQRILLPVAILEQYERKLLLHTTLTNTARLDLLVVIQKYWYSICNRSIFKLRNKNELIRILIKKNK